jgi:GTP-binding protein
MTLFESARFLTSVADPAQLAAAAPQLLPEVAFIGRSNAGKSSVINALANRRQLAFASRTPGRTQMLNFFELSERRPDGTRVPAAYVVDLPGYGFARADPATRASWDELAGGYLATRRCLAAVVLVMDARRPLMPVDRTMLDWLMRRDTRQAVRVHLLLNKADQINRAERAAALRGVQQFLATLPMRATAQLFSALTREGLEQLHATLESLIAEAVPR